MIRANDIRARCRPGLSGARLRRQSRGWSWSVRPTCRHRDPNRYPLSRSAAAAASLTIATDGLSVLGRDFVTLLGLLRQLPSFTEGRLWVETRHSRFARAVRSTPFESGH